MMTPSRTIGGYPEEYLFDLGRDLINKKTKNSKFLDKQVEKRIPKFNEKELDLGLVLGKGGFCVVQEVTKITLQGISSNNNNNDDSPEEAIGPITGRRKFIDEDYIHNVVQDRNFMEQHCIRQKNNKESCRYAIKKLKKSIRRDPQEFVSAMIDLALEARFLAVVRHPNIIKMRAMEESDPFSSGFFLILDRLYDIMPERIIKWKKGYPSGIKKYFDVKGQKAQASWVERLTVAHDIAYALSYLHGLNIIYRDLKPENIGFDVRGDVKIFDFGLAKELDLSKKLEDGTYCLTKDTGSLRYMAPEVYNGKSYNETADVYSFSILCWQILALEIPYENYNFSMLRRLVFDGGVRPQIKEKWGTEIGSFLKDSFVDNPNRPSMVDAVEMIRGQLEEFSGESVNIIDTSQLSQQSYAGLEYSGPVDEDFLDQNNGCCSIS